MSKRRFKKGQQKKKSPTVLSRRGKAKAPKVPKAKAPKVPQLREAPAFDRVTGPVSDMPQDISKAMPTSVANKMIQDLGPFARRYTAGGIAMNVADALAGSQIPQRLFGPALSRMAQSGPSWLAKPILQKLGVTPGAGLGRQLYNTGPGAGLSAFALLQPAPPDAARGQAMSGIEFAQNFPAFSEKYGEELERRGIKFYIDQAGGLQAWNRLTPWGGGR